MKIKKIILPALLLLLTAGGCFLLGSAYNSSNQLSNQKTQLKHSTLEVINPSTSKDLSSAGTEFTKSSGKAEKFNKVEAAKITSTKKNSRPAQKIKNSVSNRVADSRKNDDFNFYKIRKNPKDKVVDHNSMYEPGDRPFEVETSDLSEFSD